MAGKVVVLSGHAKICDVPHNSCGGLFRLFNCRQRQGLVAVCCGRWYCFPNSYADSLDKLGTYAYGFGDATIHAFSDTKNISYSYAYSNTDGNADSVYISGTHGHTADRIYNLL